MIPKFVRVAAIDNEADHLKKIHSALVSAGLWAMPFLYDFGTVNPTPPNPYNGIRIIFTDIHLNDGGMNNMQQQALAVITCLKKIVCDGPYILIFWTSFPQDAEKVFKEITSRSSENELVAPVGYGCIDKSLVLGLEEDPGKLPDLLAQIDTAIESCGALLLSISWEERVSQAAIRSTYRLFNLAHQEDNSLEQWHQLLAYLSTEAVGEVQARKSPVSALDAALLPILEDRLHTSTEDTNPLNSLLESKFGSGTGKVSKSSLNAHYLVSTLAKNTDTSSSSRGVVSIIDKESWDAEQSELWGGTCNDILIQEFFLAGQQDVDDNFKKQLKPCVVTLTPECDDVQGKVGSFRYLLGVLIPYSNTEKLRHYSKSKRQYSNLSIFDVGVLSVDVGDGLSDYCLLISCNRFFAKPTADLLHVEPKLRLRRATLEELSHHYATHARRPGVMRFSIY